MMLHSPQTGTVESHRLLHTRVPIIVCRSIQYVLRLADSELGCLMTKFQDEYQSYTGQCISPRMYGFNEDDWEEMFRNIPTVEVKKINEHAIVYGKPFTRDQIKYLWTKMNVHKILEFDDFENCSVDMVLGQLRILNDQLMNNTYISTIATSAGDVFDSQLHPLDNSENNEDSLGGNLPFQVTQNLSTNEIVHQDRADNITSEYEENSNSNYQESVPVNGTATFEALHLGNGSSQIIVTNQEHESVVVETSNLGQYNIEATNNPTPTTTACITQGSSQVSHPSELEVTTKENAIEKISPPEGYNMLSARPGPKRHSNSTMPLATPSKRRIVCEDNSNAQEAVHVYSCRSVSVQYTSISNNYIPPSPCWSMPEENVELDCANGVLNDLREFIRDAVLPEISQDDVQQELQQTQDLDDIEVEPIDVEIDGIFCTTSETEVTADPESVPASSQVKVARNSKNLELQFSLQNCRLNPDPGTRQNYQGNSYSCDGSSGGNNNGSRAKPEIVWKNGITVKSATEEKEILDEIGKRIRKSRSPRSYGNSKEKIHNPNLWRFVESSGFQNRFVIVACKKGNVYRRENNCWYKEKGLSLPPDSILYVEIIESQKSTPKILNIIDAAYLGNDNIQYFSFFDRHEKCEEFSQKCGPSNARHIIKCMKVHVLESLPDVLAGLATCDGVRLISDAQRSSSAAFKPTEIIFLKVHNGNNTDPDFKSSLKNIVYWKWKPELKLKDVSKELTKISNNKGSSLVPLSFSDRFASIYKHFIKTSNP